jgi:carbamate kinase
MEKIVIALGGNAILKKGEKPTIKTQSRNTRRALQSLFPVIKNNKVVITHGNGPQVGYLLLKQSSIPLDVLDAETEGQIGYLIQQGLRNLFKGKRGIVTLLTQVLVDKKDKAFQNPEKFVGPFYKTRKSGLVMKKDPRGGWRRVVSSPKPIKIIEAKTINNLLNDNDVVIAAGGGGIPVINKRGSLTGVEAVIDKDLSSACLANSVKANSLIMITDIDGVYLNYKKKSQRKLVKVTLKEVKKYYKEGHFSPGNMGPKIEAAINFLSKNGEKVIITDVVNIGKGGTIIVR